VYAVPEEKYNLLKSQESDEDAADDAERRNTLDSLKKQFVRITHRDIQLAKSVMDAYGISYIQSKGESDQLCAYLVKSNYAWACVSDDMDMFLYGCPRVLRHVSLLNHTAVLYDTEHILWDLQMSMDTFRDIMVLSGTDYNIHQETTLHETIQWYQTYAKSLFDPNGANLPFYEWLRQNTNYIQNAEHLAKTRGMFDLSKFPYMHREEIQDILARIPFRVRAPNKPILRTI
jgi:hypothetical protein